MRSGLHPAQGDANDGADDDADDQEDGTAFDRIPAIAEARLVIASLNDPNIVTVYDCQESNGRAYIIMEFVDGLTLADFLEKVGDQITLDMIAAIVAAVTCGPWRPPTAITCCTWTSSRKTC